MNASRSFQLRKSDSFPDGSVVCSRRFTRALLAGFLFLSYSAAFALDPHQPIGELYHSAWSALQGIHGEVMALAQTSDGFLWLGTSDGLLRFDGLSFERYQPDNGPLIGTMISALMSLPDGGLWIGFGRGGASLLDKGRITNYTDAQGFPVSKVRAFARDGTGVTWAAVVGGLARFDGQRWRTVRGDWNYPVKSAWTVFTDQQGNLWTATGTQLLVLPRGERQFQDTGIACNEVNGITQAVDGTIIFDDEHAKRMREIRRDQNGKITMLPDLRVSLGSPFVDRDGTLWVTAAQGLIRVPFLKQPGREEQSAELFTEKEGLTSNSAEVVLEDREGNIWVATAEGLDRFRNRNVRWFPLPGALFSLVAGSNGEVWAGSGATNSHYPLLRVDDRKPGGEPDQVYTAFHDPDGSIWYSARNALIHWKDGRFVNVPVPATVAKLSRSSSAPIVASSITRDDSGSLWVAFGGSGEFRLKNGMWTFVPVLPDHPDWAANYAFTDDADRVWLCWGDRIAQLDHGNVRVFDEQQGLSVGPYNVVAGENQEIWVGGESGLALFASGRVHTVQSAGSSGFHSVTGIVAARLDGVWLSTASGIVHIPQPEVDGLRQDPEHKVSFQLFDLVSDLPEALQPSGSFWASGALQASNGMLWFATRHGAVRVDPAHIYRNPLPPPVEICSIVADNKTYSAYSDPVLPALTKNVLIDYAALSLTMPERVRFRYKLEGWDTAWHEAASRREAYFTHLAPGRYAFRVIASNNDGVWNNQGATLHFVVEPAWYQTDWFRALCVITGLFLLWLLYRLRLRQVAKNISEKFDERMGERTRLARDLHDTFLQTIQGSKMVADDALEGCSDLRTRRSLEQLSAWLGQATEEGRAALNSLRSSATVRNDLAEALKRATESGDLRGSMSVTLSIVGSVREMHPIVRDEVYRIAYESIRNAHAHSRGSLLEVALRYGHDLCIVVRDNGVGMNPAIADHGTNGHFGLQGMKERAARIRGKLTIVSCASSGTEVSLTVPGTIAYSSEKPAFILRIRLVLGQIFHRFKPR